MGTLVAVTDACAVVCVGCAYTERMRECEGDGNDSVEDSGHVVRVSVRHEYVGGTRCSGM